MSSSFLVLSSTVSVTTVMIRRGVAGRRADGVLASVLHLSCIHGNVEVK